MTDALILRLTAAVLVFSILVCWELLLPRRPRAPGRARRWLVNLGLQAANLVLLGAVRLGYPGLLVGWAYFCEERGWGLLHRVSWRFPAKAALGYAALDLVVYLQHRLFHAAPWLWRFHRLHHGDLDLDLTTGLRFHPVEILLSLAIKAAAIAALGVHFLVVPVFEAFLNGFSLFTHANVRFFPDLKVLVTPDMHKLHHSERLEETDSNFGFQLALWDRLFRTYRFRPAVDVVYGRPARP